MSNAKSMNERQPKDERLSNLEKQLNMGVSSRLQEKYNAWSKGKPKKETSRDALAKAIEQELEVSISPATVKKHLSGDNESAVSLPILCWYAQKFGTSVNYLLTETDDAPKKQVQSETATVSGVMDALRLLLDTFENVIELTSYQQDVTFCLPSENVIEAIPRAYFALKINSDVIQQQLENWNDVIDFTRKRSDKKEKLKRMIFYSDLEAVKQDYDSISKSTGVFFNSDDQPAFIKPRSTLGAVPIVMPKNMMSWFVGKTIGWDKVILEDEADNSEEVWRPIIVNDELANNTIFCNDSVWDDIDVSRATTENGITLRMVLEQSAQNDDQKESGETE